MGRWVLLHDPHDLVVHIGPPVGDGSMIRDLFLGKGSWHHFVAKARRSSARLVAGTDEFDRGDQSRSSGCRDYAHLESVRNDRGDHKRGS